jgi:hypothetical protein
MQLRALVVAMAALVLPAVGQTQTTAQTSPPGGAQKEQLNNIVAAYTGVLSKYGLTPIIVARGERVGDTYTQNGAVLIASVDDCFPKLAPRRAPAQLPTVTGTNARGLTAALGVADVVSADLMNGFNNEFELSFKDAEAITVSISQLRAAIQSKPAECVFVRRFLEIAGAGVRLQRLSDAPLPRLTSEEAARAPVVIGTIYMARRVVSLSSSAKQDAKANLTIGQKLLERVGLGGSFSAKAGASSDEQSKVELDGNEAVPVAFSPVFKVVRSESPTVTLFSYGQESTRLVQNLATQDPKVNLTSSQFEGTGSFGYLVDPGVDQEHFQDFAKAAFGVLIQQ